MATNANIKDANSFSADNCFGLDAQTITNAELTRLSTWFSARYDAELIAAGRQGAPTADDFAALSWTELAPKVKNHEKQLLIDAVAESGEWSSI
jgi:hypothetical protein